MPGTIPPDPNDVTPAQVYMLVVKLSQELATMGRKMDDLTGEVAMGRRDTSEMVDLYKSGKTIIAVIKFAGMIATAMLAVWGVIALVKGIPNQAPTP